jgi:PAS domain S-box-containing protein
VVNDELIVTGSWKVSTAEANLGGGHASARLIHPDDQPSATQAMEMHLSGKSPAIECEARMMDRDGRWRWLLARGKATQRDSKGSPTFVMGTYVDITARKHVEKERRDAEEKFRAISQSSPDHIIMHDLWLRYVWVLNPQFGLTEKDMIGKTDYEILPKEDADRLVLVKSKVLSSGERTRYTDSLIALDGSRQHFNGEFIPQFNARGEVAGMIGYFRNVTEDVRAREALRLANHKLNLMSSITRHDIINQLIILEGHLSLIEEGGMSRSGRESLAHAERAADRISAMIRFTKEYENIGVIGPSWQNARTLVEASAAEWQLHPMKIVNDMPPDIDLFGDPMMPRVFTNLINNAILHGESATFVRFSARQDHNSLTVTCEDDGVGISEEARGTLFSRNFNNEHGLGLFLCREILAIAGIEMNENGAPGHGARFEMTADIGSWRRRKEKHPA